MLFNSAHFLIFFPVLVTVYFAVNKRYRNYLLLFASWYFYMSWKVEYIILILLSISIDYISGLKIANLSNNKKRLLYLYFSVFSNLGILAAFKYFNFISENVFSIFHPNKEFDAFNIILPVGISFYTFQSLSYTIDVYRKKIQAEKSFVKFALYVSFFPQLVAGPIERAKNLLTQFSKNIVFDYQRVTYGLKLMTWGFFQKVAIADNMARFVDAVYADPESYYGMNVILIVFLFAIQIYADFSGYTDIARGAAKILGFDLMINFKQPYFASSIKDFWRRWHISLTTWFRDYLYFSLGGNRLTKKRWFFAIFLTFVLSGLWHGAKWTFVVWGGYHALLYLIELFLNRYSNINKYLDYKAVKIIRTLLVFCLVAIGFMIFRADSLNDFYTLFSNIYSKGFPLKIIFDNKLLLQNLFSVTLIAIVWMIERKQDIVNFVSSKSLVFRWSVYILSIFYIIGFGYWEEQVFIYFQF